MTRITALTTLTNAQDRARVAAMPVVGRCECADHPDEPHPSGWPRCDGRIRRYPSGRASCDCGQH